MSLNNYTQLSYEKRVIIKNRLKNNESIRYIAQKIDRNPSTTMREIKRNGFKATTSIFTAFSFAISMFLPLQYTIGRSPIYVCCYS